MIRDTGALDLPLDVVGEVMQSLGRVLVDRGHDEAAVRTRLLTWAEGGGEATWWEATGGEIVDDLAHQMGLDPYP